MNASGARSPATAPTGSLRRAGAAWSGRGTLQRLARFDTSGTHWVPGAESELVATTSTSSASQGARTGDMRRAYRALRYDPDVYAGADAG